MVDYHWDQLVLGLGYHFCHFSLKKGKKSEKLGFWLSKFESKMVGYHWEQLVLGLGYHFLSFQSQKRLKNRISIFEFPARHQQKCSKTPFLGYLVPPKGYRGVLHRCMGKVKKFEPSSTLILRRNSHRKKVRAESAPLHYQG